MIDEYNLPFDDWIEMKQWITDLNLVGSIPPYPGTILVERVDRLGEIGTMFKLKFSEFYVTSHHCQMKGNAIYTFRYGTTNLINNEVTI